MTYAEYLRVAWALLHFDLVIVVTGYDFGRTAPCPE